MAIVRCEQHPVHLELTTNKYVKRVKPVGYPDTAAICGIAHCREPGLVWLTEEELKEFNSGVRYFRVKTYTVKVKVSDSLLPLP
jgi:hypothetical protein